MKKRSGSYPRVCIEGGGRTVVSQSGGVLLVETVRKAGLSAALTPWRKLQAVHDPGKVLLDVALAVALGRDCLADVAMLRAEPAVFGPEPPTRRSPGSLTPSRPPGRTPCGPFVPCGLKSADESGGWPTGKRQMRTGR